MAVWTGATPKMETTMATTAGRRSWALVAGVGAMSVGLRLVGCTPEPTTPPGPPPSELGEADILLALA